MKNVFDTIIFKEILTGLGITFKHMFKKPVTTMYPYKEPVIMDRFRGIHYINAHEDGTTKCVGCYLCQRVCPSDCIHIETDCGPNGERLVRKFHIELDRCIYCGFCEEACPKDAIHMGRRFDTVDKTRDKYTVNMAYLINNKEGE